MLTIAYWNVNDKSIDDHVVSLAMQLQGTTKSDVVLCLSEKGGINIPYVIQKIASLGGGHWSDQVPKNNKFACIFNLPRDNLVSGNEIARSWQTTIIRGTPEEPREFYIWFVHLKSPHGSWKSQSVQDREAGLLRKAIDQQSKFVTDTVVIGDFNMEPFSPAMVNPDKMNAVMCQRIAKKVSRLIDGDKCHFFYNPTWKLLGDQTSNNQPGTFYNGGDSGDSTYWHMIDQALVRPDMIAAMPTNGFRVLTHSGKSNLLTANDLINNTISDHLPIAIQLNI